MNMHLSKFMRQLYNAIGTLVKNFKFLDRVSTRKRDQTFRNYYVPFSVSIIFPVARSRQSTTPATSKPTAAAPTTTPHKLAALEATAFTLRLLVEAFPLPVETSPFPIEASSLPEASAISLLYRSLIMWLLLVAGSATALLLLLILRLGIVEARPLTLLTAKAASSPATVSTSPWRTVAVVTAIGLLLVIETRSFRSLCKSSTTLGIESTASSSALVEPTPCAALPEPATFHSQRPVSEAFSPLLEFTATATVFRQICRLVRLLVRLVVPVEPSFTLLAAWRPLLPLAPWWSLAGPVHSTATMHSHVPVNCAVQLQCLVDCNTNCCWRKAEGPENFLWVQQFFCVQGCTHACRQTSCCTPNKIASHTLGSVKGVQ